jgi:preprotein translocase subunit SecB
MNMAKLVIDPKIFFSLSIESQRALEEKFEVVLRVK